MFERFSESARRALFFARYEVTELGGTSIEPEHLVFGILRAAPKAVLVFTRAGETAQALRARLEAAAGAARHVETSVEIPFSLEARAVLEQTAIEADALKNHQIRPEHILLGVMVRTHGAATRALHDAGVEIGAV